MSETGTKFSKAEPYRLDTVTLEGFAELLPEAMRNDFLWLGAFFREDCRRSLEILMERCKKLGINHDKTTWSKILRGKWNRDSNNQPLQVPIISVEKFTRAIGLLRTDERVREMAGKVPFVETTTSKAIFRYIDAKRARDRVNKFGVIIGPTGSQKSASLKEYCRANNHGLCVWQEAPENGSMKEFISRLGEKYGIGVHESYDRKRTRVIESVSDAKTIVVDNCQKLYKERNGVDQPVFSFLQRIQDETGCTIILSITPTFEKTLTAGMAQGYFEQFEGRAGGRKNFLRLPEYAPEDDVLAIAKAFGLREAEKHLEYLVRVAHEPGKIRILFEALQEAKVAAEAEQAKLTIEHVKEARGEE
jgi:DNA transposition AAA+ family ATPase